jgi:hypothetical protein
MYYQPVLVASHAKENASSVEDGTVDLSTLHDSDTVQTPEGVSPLGASILAQSVLAYDQAAQAASSSDAGVAAVQSYASSVRPEVSYKTYTTGDIHTVEDNSKERAFTYREDLKIALAPLLDNKDYEIDLFGKYIETKDPNYLSALRAAAANYRRAIANTELVVAPTDAATYQAGILTAMNKFAATLEVMADNATDSIASAALLRTFLDAQDTMLTSFNSVAKYSTQHTL